MTRGHSPTVFGYRPFRAHSSGQTVINFVSGSLWMMPTCAGAENGFSAEPSESADPEAEPLCSGAQHESVRSRLTPEPCNGPCLSSNLLNTNLKSCPSADPSAGSGLGSVGAAPARLRPCPDGPEVHSGPWLDDFVLVPASKVFLHAPQQNLRRGSDGWHDCAAKRASGCASRLHAGWMHCSGRRAGWGTDPSAGNGFHGILCVEHSVSKRGQQCELIQNLEPNPNLQS